MNIFLQAMTAFFAVIGLFECVWQIILFATRRSVRCRRARIILEADDCTDPEFLTENLRLLTDQIAACSQTEVWLICRPGTEREDFYHRLANRYEGVRILSPEEASAEFAEEFSI